MFLEKVKLFVNVWFIANSDIMVSNQHRSSEFSQTGYTFLSSLGKTDEVPCELLLSDELQSAVALYGDWTSDDIDKDECERLYLFEDRSEDFSFIEDRSDKS